MLEMGLIVGLISLVIIGSQQIIADRISASLTLSDTSSTKPESDLLFNPGGPMTLSDSPGGILQEPPKKPVEQPLSSGPPLRGWFGR
jgi:hypothetical protein